MQDANWNVTTIANTSATAQERYAYSAYGYPSYFDSTFVSRANSSFTWETLYCGYRYDWTLRLHCVRFRAYHAILGVWCQRDPVGYSGSMNLYRYVNSKPIDRLDPNGLAEFDDLTERPEFVWKIDVKSCEIEMTIKMCLNLNAKFDAEEQPEIESMIRNAVEHVWNGSQTRIFPDNPNCPCNTGWIPKLKVDFTRASPAVQVDFSRDPVQSSAGSDDNSISATLDISDLLLSTDTVTPLSSAYLQQNIPSEFMGNTYKQLSLVHEVGHMMGLWHPGSPFIRTLAREQVNSFIQSDLRDFAYWKDAPGLMGVGMAMRPRYYSPWAAKLNSDDQRCTAKCGNFTAR